MLRMKILFISLVALVNFNKQPAIKLKPKASMAGIFIKIENTSDSQFGCCDFDQP